MELNEKLANAFGGGLGKKHDKIIFLNLWPPIRFGSLGVVMP